jgi:hypothetical protein
MAMIANDALCEAEGAGTDGVTLTPALRFARPFDLVARPLWHMAMPNNCFNAATSEHVTGRLWPDQLEPQQPGDGAT